MKLFSANIESLQGLYITDLKKALGMEQKIVRILPVMIDNCSDTGVAAAFRKHLDETKDHVFKLEGVLRRLIGEAPIEACKVTNSLMTAASEIIRDVHDPFVRDIALVGVAKQIGHHEIAVYDTLKHWAKLLDMQQDTRVLQTIEDAKLDAILLLTDLSRRVDLELAA